MLLRLATFGALGYAAYNYYTKNREQVDETLRRFSQGAREAMGGQDSEATEEDETVEVAGGPLSDEARVVHAGEEPVA